MTDLPSDAEAVATRMLSFDERIADVCPTCGQHMLKTYVERLEWITKGGTVRCRFCNIEKTR